MAAVDENGEEMGGGGGGQMMEEESGGDVNWSCSFETTSGADTWCDVTQASDDDFDWSFGNGPTPSNPTGPSKGHSGPYFTFIEATRRQYNDRAG